EPAQHGRRAAGPAAGPGRVGQQRPVQARPGVVLGVVAVVEEQEVIEGAVVADGAAARVLVVAVQGAQTQAEEVAGDVGGQEEPGVPGKQRTPQGQDQGRLDGGAAAPAPPPGDPGAGGQGPGAADRLAPAQPPGPGQ